MRVHVFFNFSTLYGFLQQQNASKTLYFALFLALARAGFSTELRHVMLTG